MNEMTNKENYLQQNYSNNYSVPQYNILQDGQNFQGVNQPYFTLSNNNANNLSNYSEQNNFQNQISNIPQDSSLTSNSVKNTNNPNI